MMLNLSSLRIDEQTSALIDAYRDLLSIRHDSPEIEKAKKARALLLSQIAARTGRAENDIHAACYLAGAS